MLFEVLLLLHGAGGRHRRLTSSSCAAVGDAARERTSDLLGGRLTAVRQFARYLQGFESATEIPGTRLLPFRPKRCKPYLYSQEEIEA